MNRNISCTALALHSRQFGESNREASFLTKEAGVIRAVLYGGPKSRLRAFVSPFHSGLLYLYHDPARDSYKVTDFDVRAWRPGIREDYERTVTSTAIAQAILAGHGGGGGWEEAYALAASTLDAIERADAARTRRLFVYFLWKWADILGARPEIDRNAALSIENPAALRWLYGVDGLSAAEAAETALDGAALSAAKNSALEALRAAFGRKLESWAAL
jgi:DNA repair protein RecO (recombination protein O)